ncbi:hypothetical protein GE061_000216 [Apolygus lucorum]|uniref:Peptidase C1A papain C-terminal domain-containing protein n=1 Tax=Apolygus lucorum TaxID=248454 RepID=A0A8S9Y5L7_APOLU|nr:hypothetical protein GE061_000216 [Apolygus lucorum]
MNTILVFASLIGCCLAVSVSVLDWEAYKSLYGKNYEDPEEDAMRKMTYEMNLEKFEAHNARHQQGLESYTMGVNHFSDWSDSEQQNGFNQYDSSPEGVTYVFHEPSGKGLPESVDWREENVVTSVKQQGECGSCWAFASTAAVESHYAIEQGLLVDFSEQQLVDCLQPEKYGCKYGYVNESFVYMTNHRLLTFAEYPYKDQVGECEYDDDFRGLKISGYKRIPKGDEEALQDAVAHVGPVAVSIDYTPLKPYTQGIYVPSKRNTDHGDTHIVLIVGYDTNEDGEEYYIAKNSWGPKWGLQGYFHLKRNAEYNTGVADYAFYPVL